MSKSIFKADTIYFNGTILTMDNDGTTAKAIAVVNDRIAAVGDAAEIEAYKSERTKIVDLEGRTLMPGFVDAHSHFPMSGQVALKRVEVNSPHRGKFDTIDSIVEALRERAKTTPKGEWVVGVGYDHIQLKERRHPTKEDLDRVSEDHPVWLQHYSFHLGVANSMALDMASITRESVADVGGHICKDPETGDVTGLLEEIPGMQAIYALLPASTLQDDLEAIKFAGREYASAGVTSAQNSMASKSNIEHLTVAAKEGVLPIRVVYFPKWEIALEISRGDYSVDSSLNSMLACGAAKVFSDGSLPGYSAYLSEPYYVNEEHDSDYRGYPRYDPNTMFEIINELNEEGLHIAVHANGDGGLDDTLVAFEKALAANPREDHRHQVIHVQVCREDQIDKIKALGITPTFLSTHNYYWGDAYRETILGPERAARVNPARSCVDRGIPITLHCDTPVVRMDPLFSVWAAVNRLTASGKVNGPEQCLTVMEALRGITIDAAWQVFREKDVGSIEPGKYADLVVLSENPVEVPSAIHKITVLETIVGGNTIYKR